MTTTTGKKKPPCSLFSGGGSIRVSSNEKLFCARIYIIYIYGFVRIDSGLVEISRIIFHGTTIPLSHYIYTYIEYRRRSSSLSDKRITLAIIKVKKKSLATQRRVKNRQTVGGSRLFKIIAKGSSDAYHNILIRCRRYYIIIIIIIMYVIVVVHTHTHTHNTAAADGYSR